MAELISQRCHGESCNGLTAVSQQHKAVLEDNRESSVQRKQLSTLQRNNTGLPDHLKSGMENLSGINLDQVKVHYNSPKPAAVQAHAYAQGNQIHLASGQEKHLPHELGHVVQQAQGRVKPTINVAGMPVNDDVALEKEADLMGEKALQRQPLVSHCHTVQPANIVDSTAPIQGAWVYSDEDDWWEENVEGFIYDPETHEWQWGDADEYPNPRAMELAHARFRESLFEAMDRDELLTYMNDERTALPGNAHIQAVDDALPDVEFDEDEGVNISVMGDEGDPVPVSVDLATLDDVNYAGSYGANNCVIVLIRATDGERTYAGSVHLSASELDSAANAIRNLLALRQSIVTAMGDHAMVGLPDCYAVGGEASDDADDLRAYTTLFNAFETVRNEMRLVGVRMPASDEGGYVDASITSNAVRFHAVEAEIEAEADETDDDGEVSDGVQLEKKVNSLATNTVQKYEINNAPQTLKAMPNISQQPVLQGGFMEWVVKYLALSAAGQSLFAMGQPLAPQFGGYADNSMGTNASVAFGHSDFSPEMFDYGAVPFNLTGSSVAEFEPDWMGELVEAPEFMDEFMDTPELETVPEMISEPVKETVRASLDKPEPGSIVNKNGKITFANPTDQSRYDKGGAGRLVVESKAIKNLLRSTKTGQAITDKLDELGEDPLLVREDLGYGRSGEADPREKRFIKVHSKRGYVQNTIIAAHELKHREQFGLGQIDENSNPYRLATAEIFAKKVGLDMYQELYDAGYIPPMDKDTQDQEYDLIDHQDDPEAYERQVFRQYLSLYRRGDTDSYPDFSSDAALDQHIEDQKAYFETRAALSNIEKEIKDAGYSPNSYDLPESFKTELLEARRNNNKAKKKAKKSQP